MCVDSCVAIELSGFISSAYYSMDLHAGSVKQLLGRQEDRTRLGQELACFVQGKNLQGHAL